MKEINISKIPEFIEKGSFHKDWFSKESGKLYELLPEFKGFPLERVFAVTSMTTSIEANVHLALRALIQWRKQEPFTRFLPTQIIYLNLIREGKDVPGRKIMSFIKALEGDANAVVVDIWMCRAFGLNKDRILKRPVKNGFINRKYTYSPSKKEYDIIERYCKDYAWWYDCEPRQIQSMIWAGIKQEQGNLSKNVSWSDLLRKKKGMFSYEKDVCY